MVTRIVAERCDVGVERGGEFVTVIPKLITVIDEHALSFVCLMHPGTLVGVHLLRHTVSNALIDAEEAKHVRVDPAWVNIILLSKTLEEAIDHIIVVVAVSVSSIGQTRKNGLVGQWWVGEEHVVHEGSEAVPARRIDRKRTSSFIAFGIIFHDALDLNAQKGKVLWIPLTRGCGADGNNRDVDGVERSSAEDEYCVLFGKAFAFGSCRIRQQRDGFASKEGGGVEWEVRRSRRDSGSAQTFNRTKRCPAIEAHHAYENWRDGAVKEVGPGVCEEAFHKRAARFDAACVV